MNDYLLFWKKAFDFKSYASKRQFNIPFWSHIALIIILRYVAPFVSVENKVMKTNISIGNWLINIPWNMLQLVVLIVLFIPTYALISRRFNDFGKEKEWTLYIMFFPVVYSFIIIMLIVVGQGMPADVVWIDYVFMVIMILPVLYLVYLLFQLTLAQSKRVTTQYVKS